MPVKQSLKTINELPKRLLDFAEIMAKGQSTAAGAAREVGFKPTTALAASYKWIGRTREASKYPFLFDYYQNIRNEHLRRFGVSAETIASELQIVAFSSIDKFLDLPSREVHRKVEKAEETMTRLNAELDKLWVDASLITDDSPIPDSDVKKRKPKGGYYSDPIAAGKLKEAIRKLAHHHRKLTSGPGYKLRLKFIEDIPKELIPAIAEISETKDGIKVKLHNKLEGLDKLARWMKMYDSMREGGAEKIAEVTEITVEIMGSHSDLLLPENTPPQS